MKINSTWKGNPDPNITSGIAGFSYGSTNVNVKLESFTDYRALSTLLTAAYNDGVKDQRIATKAMIEAMLKEIT